MKLRAVVLGLLCASSLLAAPRTFVSPAGLDTNPCSLSLPCRTFQTAVNVTDNGGEVVAIGSAGFGPVVINQSITITAPSGVYAGIAVGSTGTGVVVNGAVQSAVLRGLALNGAADSFYGIIAGGQTVRVENCTIAGFQWGIWDNDGMQLFVTDTLLRDNNVGISLASGTGTIDHVRFEHNSDTGLFVYGASAMIHDSIASENNKGFRVENMSTTSSIAFFDGCTAANNSIGILVTGSIMLLRDCTSTRNAYGVEGAGSTVYSQGNNSINLNTVSNTFGVTFTTAPSS